MPDLTATFRLTININQKIYDLALKLTLFCRKLWYGYPFRRIPLTKGRYAIVDPEDYPRLIKYKWCAQPAYNSFYAVTWYRLPDSAKRVHLIMHRYIMSELHPERCTLRPGLMIDHLDGNGLDNRKANLRIATRAQNSRNRGKNRTAWISRYKGVTKNRKNGKWLAAIRGNGKFIHLGSFEIEEDAARAYDRAARKYHGEFARLNFPV